MKTTHIILSIAGIAAAFALGIGVTKYTMKATASPDDGMATILSVKPHTVTTKTPIRVCRTEESVVYSKEPSSVPYAGAVIGGVAGGLLGNQIGRGTGRDIATAVGALGGAYAGNTVQENLNQAQPHTVGSTRCVKQMKSVQKQQGYEVTYSYQGTQGVRILQNKPIGTKIAVSILQAAPELEQSIEK